MHDSNKLIKIILGI